MIHAHWKNDSVQEEDFWNNLPPVPGEILLWLAVVKQAIWDLNDKKHCSEARTFFFDERSTFSEICVMIGIDPDAVRSRISRLLTSGNEVPCLINARRAFRARAGSSSRAKVSGGHREKMNSFRPLPLPCRPGHGGVA